MERPKYPDHTDLTGPRYWRLLLRDPAAWSARWYALKSTYENVAVRSDLHRERPADPPPPGRLDRLKRRVAERLAAALAETGWGDERPDEPNPEV